MAYECKMECFCILSFQKKYREIAEQFPVHAYYYAGERNVVPSVSVSKQTFGVCVIVNDFSVKRRHQLKGR